MSDFTRMVGKTTVKELKKSQIVRLFDVFFLGPVLVYYGLDSKISKTGKILLISFGLGTIYYNGRNYLRNINQK